MRYLYFAVAFYVVVYSLSLAGALLLRLHDAFRSRRRGGARKRSASSTTNRAATSTTAPTLSNVVYFSSGGRRGPVWAAEATRLTPAERSRNTAATSCGQLASVGTAPGQQHGLAG